MMVKKNEDPDKNDDSSSAEDDEKDEVTKAVEAVLNKRLAGAQRQARRAGRDELLKDLGFEGDLGSLKELLEKAEAAASKPKPKADDSGSGKADEATEQRLKDLEEKLSKSERATSATAAENLISRVTIELMERGLGLKAAKRAARLVTFDKPSVSDDDIADAIEELEEDMPELFPEEDDNDDDDTEDEREPRGKRRSEEKPKPKPSNPGGPPPSRKRPSDPRESARALLATRHPHTAKK